ncbi:MAG TPA: hypothetical protein VGL00_11830, partial [Terracidiphilus sp.]
NANRIRPFTLTFCQLNPEHVDYIRTVPLVTLNGAGSGHWDESRRSMFVGRSLVEFSKSTDWPFLVNLLVKCRLERLGTDI